MNRPAFKNSELGPIPVDWEVKRLGVLCDIQLGKMLDEEKNVGEWKPYLGNRAVQWNRIVLEDLSQVRLTDEDKRRYALCFGDLLVCEGGEVGRAAIWRDELSECYYQKALHRLRAREPQTISMEFLLQVFYFYACSGVFDSVVAKTSIAHLPKDKLEMLQVPCPSMPEQQLIVSALSDADAWIESLDKLIEKKKLVKQGAMQALLSGKTRLPGFSGEWEDEVVGDAFVFLRTNTLSRSCLGETGCISDVHYGDVLVRYDNILDFSAETPPFIGEGHESRSIGDFLHDGDLVVADTAEDATVGKAVEIQHLGNRQAVAGLHTVACRPKQPFAPGWLGHFVNSPSFHDQLLPLISGTKVSSISKENLKTVFVRRPPLSEQAAIASALSDMDAELAALTREKAKAEQIKQGMMQELLTGRVRLNG